MFVEWASKELLFAVVFNETNRNSTEIVLIDVNTGNSMRLNLHLKHIYIYR